jgi:hypothetical protein
MVPQRICRPLRSSFYYGSFPFFPYMYHGFYERVDAKGVYAYCCSTSCRGSSPLTIPTWRRECQKRGRKSNLPMGVTLPLFFPLNELAGFVTVLHAAANNKLFECIGTSTRFYGESTNGNLEVNTQHRVQGARARPTTTFRKLETIENSSRLSS